MSGYNSHEFLSALENFKTRLCDENVYISDIIGRQLKSFLVPPLLDVGSGLGDIAERAFPEMRSVLLDIMEVPQGGNPLHTRVTGDFFEYASKVDGEKTIIFSHVFQYLDGDIAKLKAKISELDPLVIIDVANDNSGSFGRIVSWAFDHIHGVNPEFRLDFFGEIGYELVQSIGFCAKLSCDDFCSLARYVSVFLLDAQDEHSCVDVVERMLREELSSPQLPINETVYCYVRKK